MSTLSQVPEMQNQAPPLLTEQPTQQLQVNAPESQLEAGAPKGDSKMYSRRLLIHTSASAQELAAGKVLTIPDGTYIPYIIPSTFCF